MSNAGRESKSVDPRRSLR